MIKKTANAIALLQEFTGYKTASRTAEFAVENFPLILHDNMVIIQILKNRNIKLGEKITVFENGKPFSVEI